ncbi:MBL fold metallo-hydrolase [Salisaeta longa]|uniref:MBL fold metallo-hydrolase n=1 Tax=Salisaeta longa TaxID=503170 RepID=UPI0003B4D249|nr:MBL fold metallo-hydrolase [Salisaeta longa]
MPALHLLGTGASISDAHRTTTMLALSDATAGATLLVDCGGDVYQRWMATVPDAHINDLAALLITHAHPDHTSGFPLFMEKAWLAERTAPVPVCGIEHALAQVQRTWTAFDAITDAWDVPPIDWRTIDAARDAVVWDTPPWHVTAAPVAHGSTPNVGFRFEHLPTGHVVAYSSDTTPCDGVRHLARDAHVLVHEANGNAPEVHSTAAEAAQVAATADVDHLLLVHLPPGDKRAALQEARAHFPNTDLGTEGGTYAW